MSQPEMRVDKYGIKKWYLNSNLHREDGPAVEWSSGSKWWYLHGEKHREDGPATIQYENDKIFSEYYFQLGRPCNPRGPDIIIYHSDGIVEYKHSS